jgi:ABC-type amino acid transport system permease subunit
MCVQFGVIISLLVMICGLCVGQVIMTVQRDPSESVIQSKVFYISFNRGLKLKLLQKVLQVSVSIARDTCRLCQNVTFTTSV